jgi:hypothetical protein
MPEIPWTDGKTPIGEGNINVTGPTWQNKLATALARLVSKALRNADGYALDADTVLGIAPSDGIAWSPIPTASGGGTLGYSSVGSYWKMGKLVVAMGRVYISNNNGNTTNPKITNFPFPFSATRYCGGAMRDSGIGHLCGFTGSPGTTYGALFKYDNTYPWVNGSSDEFTIVYVTD